MKKLLLSLLVVAGVLSASAQGTFNGTADMSLTIGRCYEYNGGAPGVVPLGPTSVGQWYFGAAGITDDRQLTATGAPQAFSSGYCSPGTYSPPWAGATLTFQFRAWHSAQGSSYESQLANPAGFSGKSELVQVTGVSTPIPIPPIIFNVSGFTLSSNVPEPSTIALGVLGLSALVFRRRK